MTPRAERLFIIACKLLIVVCAVATLVALSGCSCQSYGYCPPAFPAAAR